MRPIGRIKDALSVCLSCIYAPSDGIIWLQNAPRGPHGAKLPTQARIIIIGCPVAYHLTKMGWTDVLLLEQGQLSGGTTWHAAGLVGQLRSHAGMTGLIRYSTQLYSELEAETGLATGWKQCGSLSVARSEDRMTILKRTAASARAQDVERVRVTGITTQNGAVTGVRTSEGDVKAEIVVNCAGQRVRKIGQMCGVSVPLHSAEHHPVHA